MTIGTFVISHQHPDPSQDGKVPKGQLGPNVGINGYGTLTVPTVAGQILILDNYNCNGLINAATIRGINIMITTKRQTQRAVQIPGETSGGKVDAPLRESTVVGGGGNVDAQG